MKEKLYSFLWVGGGYNRVWARNKKEAIKKAKAMTSNLIPREDTFTTKKSVLDALDKAYEGCGD